MPRGKPSQEARMKQNKELDKQGNEGKTFYVMYILKRPVRSVIL